ncbi:MAG: lysophospholipid acyltransferase family protein [Pseudomonadota bacterium]
MATSDMAPAPADEPATRPRGVTPRSLAFAVLFYVVTALFLILGSPLLFGPRSWAMAGLKAHARAILVLLRIVAGTRMEVRGREHLPDGPCLAVAKHQSAWETMALIPLFRDPAIVLKAELARIPLYGWFCVKFEHVLVRRDRQAAALKLMVADARERVAAGREVLIFPEGTRKAPGAAPDYKPGFVALYDGLDVPLVPIALNSGVFWPPKSSLAYPGTIIVDIAPPILPGKNRREVRDEMIDIIEARTAALQREAGFDGPVTT